MWRPLVLNRHGFDGSDAGGRYPVGEVGLRANVGRRGGRIACVQVISMSRWTRGRSEKNPWNWWQRARIEPRGQSLGNRWMGRGACQWHRPPRRSAWERFEPPPREGFVNAITQRGECLGGGFGILWGLPPRALWALSGVGPVPTDNGIPEGAQRGLCPVPLVPDQSHGHELRFSGPRE